MRTVRPGPGLATLCECIADPALPNGRCCERNGTKSRKSRSRRRIHSKENPPGLRFAYRLGGFSGHRVESVGEALCAGLLSRKSFGSDTNRSLDLVFIDCVGVFAPLSGEAHATVEEKVEHKAVVV